MRLLLETRERTWPIEPGLTLLGGAPDCHVRLEGGPRHVAAIVRWFNRSVLYPIGNPSPLRINGQLMVAHELLDGDILWLGGQEIHVRFDPPAESQVWLPEGAELGRRVRRALDAGRAFAGSEAPRDRRKKLLRVVSGVTGSRSASFPREAREDGLELTLYREQSRPLSLKWGKKSAPGRRELELGLASLGAALDEHFRWQGTRGAAVVPYRDYTIRLRGQEMRVGAYAQLGWHDVSHLEVSRADVRDPLLLVTTFDERLQMVDLTGEGALRDGGRAVGHLSAEPQGQLTLLGHLLEASPNPPLAALLPMRLQSAIGMADDPITGAASLGFLLATLKLAEQRAEASLLASVVLSHAHAGAIVWTGGEGSSLVTTLLELSRHSSTSWMRSSGIPSRQLDALVRRAVGSGEPAFSEDILEDPALWEEDYLLGESLAVVGSALAIPLSPKGACLLLTRGRGRRRFTRDDRRVALELARSIEPLDLSGHQRPPALLERRREAPEPAAAWLCAGRVRIPLPARGAIVLGREEGCDVRISGDGTVSRQHALVVASAGHHCQVVDLRSSNGTFVDGKLVEQAVLQPGSCLGVGELELRYEIDAGRMPEPEAYEYCPSGRPIEDLKPAPLGAVGAPDESRALEAALPAVALVTGASKAHWVVEKLLASGGPEGAFFKVPASIGAGGWVTLDGVTACAQEDRHSRLLRVQDGQGSHLVHRPLWVGRGLECDIRIDEPTVSRRHALLVPTAAGCEVIDARSSAGVRVNGQRVRRAGLASGDLLEIGPASLFLAEQPFTEGMKAAGMEDAKQLLHVLGEVRSGGMDPLERIAENARVRLQASAVGVFRAGERVPVAGAGPEEVDPGLLAELQGAVENCLGSGCFLAVDLSGATLYRMRDVSLRLPRVTARAALVMPVPGKPPTVAVALTARTVSVAFDFGSARWMTGLISVLT